MCDLNLLDKQGPAVQLFVELPVVSFASIVLLETLLSTLCRIAGISAVDAQPYDLFVCAPARQAEARSHLSEAWTVDDIPSVYVHELQRPRLIQKEVLAGNQTCMHWLRTNAAEVDQIRATAAELMRERPAAAELGLDETLINLVKIR